MGGETPKAAAPPQPAEVTEPAPRVKPNSRRPNPRTQRAGTSHVDDQGASLAPVKKEVPESLQRTMSGGSTSGSGRCRARIPRASTRSQGDAERHPQYWMYRETREGGRGPSGPPFLEAPSRSTPPRQRTRRTYGNDPEAHGSSPLSAKKDLQTLITITIRKDGRITDWQIDRTGEQGLRRVRNPGPRSIAPPIPASLSVDSIQMSFDFHPGGGLRWHQRSGRPHGRSHFPNLRSLCWKLRMARRKSTFLKSGQRASQK